MDRNEKSLLEWDWENHGLFSAEKEVEISEFGNRSSKSSISASIDSSSKEGLKISKSGLSKKKELTSVEPLIGLMLGKRTYFEDVTSIGNNSTKNSTCSTSPVPPTALVKKTRVSHQSIPNSCCQVEGCGIDLSGAKDYHRKNRVCESHSKCPKVIIAGLERRFCQQCSRFHDLREFDLKKRSCRRRLSDHNARRRKPQSDLSFNSTGLSSPFYGALLDGSDRIGFGLEAQIGLDFIWRPGFSLGLAWWRTLARVWLNSSEMACIWLGSSNRFVFWLSSSYWSASAGSSDRLVMVPLLACENDTHFDSLLASF